MQVNGLIDPSNAALIRSSIRDAERVHSTVVVFQLDASGAVDVDVNALLHDFTHATVPVTVWVGPSGGGARGAAALLARSADFAAVAPGAHLGPVDPDPLRRHRRSRSTAPTEERHRQGRDARSSSSVCSTAGRSRPRPGPVKLSTIKVVELNGSPTREPKGEVHFRKLGSRRPARAHARRALGCVFPVRRRARADRLRVLLGRCRRRRLRRARSRSSAALFRVLASPGRAVGGRDCCCSASSAWSIDVQAGHARTVDVHRRRVARRGIDLALRRFVASRSRVVGSRRSSSCGTVLFMLSGMTAMVRSRSRRRRSVARSSSGEMGLAEVDVDPDGVVRIRDALWRARTNRATPIHAGDRGPRRVDRGRGAGGRARDGRRARSPRAPAPLLTSPFVSASGPEIRSASSHGCCGDGVGRGTQHRS